ncbi:MAG: AAA family ATPase [Myxococcota bacterium]
MSRLDPTAREVAVLARAGYPLVYLVTQEEQRARFIVDQAAEAIRRSLVSWSVTEGLEGAGEATADPEVALQSLESTDQPTFVVFLDLHRYLDQPRVVRRLRDRLADVARRRQTLVIIAPELVLPAELEKDAAIIDLPLPRADELLRELTKVAESEKRAIDPDVAERAVRSALGLALNEAHRVFRKVIVLKKGLTDQDLKLVVEEKKAILRRTEVLEFHELGDGLGQVGGLGELKRWLQARSRAFGEQARAFGLPPPKGLLLLGVQGCGKSLSAKAVAELWKFPLLRLDVGALFSNVGSPESAVREAIKISERLAPVVLWVDEIEKGFVQAEGTDSSSRVFGSFITWLAEKQAEVFVVATANDVSALPPELLRKGRFDEIFFVDLPNVHERLEVLRIHLAKRQRDPKLFKDLEQLAQRTEHFSGAELEQVVVAALYRAFSDDRDVTDQDLDLAAQQTVPLYRTYEEKIKALRDWAKRRARPATQDSTVLDLFA